MNKRQMLIPTLALQVLSFIGSMLVSLAFYRWHLLQPLSRQSANVTQLNCEPRQLT
jgi:hypothetical protein